MVPGVAGSNPVIRPSYKECPLLRVFFITLGVSDENRRRKPFEKVYGSTPFAHSAILQGDEVIRLSAPVIKKPVSCRFFITLVGSGSNRRFAYESARRTKRNRARTSGEQHRQVR